MSAYTWTFSGSNGGSQPPVRRWTLDADPRYAVEQQGELSYAMFVNGYEVDAADTDSAARERLEGVFAYEEHFSDLELARLRLRQARERLAARYPRAAGDAQLVSVLEGLADALGTGPEATEP